MVKAYVGVKVEHGKLPAALSAIRGIPGVRSADAITGSYDVIALVEGDDLDSLGKKVVNDIQSVAGVWRTLTSIVVNL